MKIHINYLYVACVTFLLSLYSKNLFEVPSLLQENNKKTY